MYNRKFFALFMLGMLLFTAVMCTGGCGGSSGSEVSVNNDPTPNQSPDVTPVPDQSQIYYTVTFDSDGGSSVTSQKVPAGGTVTKPENPVKEGYVFSGWFKDKGRTVLFKFGENGDKVTQDITLYARWLDTDIFIAEYSLSEIVIGYADGDNPKYVTQNLTLPTKINSADISWSSSSGAVATDGTVTRQAEDTDVTLTATASYNGKSAEPKTFELRVIRRRTRDNSAIKVLSIEEASSGDIGITRNDSGDITEIEGQYVSFDIRNADDALDAVTVLRDELGMRSPDKELKTFLATSNSYGAEYSFQQMYKGVKVYGRSLMASVNASGRGDFMHSSILASNILDSADMKINLTASQAESIVASAYSGDVEIDTERTERIVYSLEDYADKPVYAYVVRVYGTSGSEYADDDVLVNADTGQIIINMSNMAFNTVSADGKNESGDTVSFDVLRKIEIHRRTSSIHYVMYDPKLHVEIKENILSPVKSLTNTWNDPVAVSAYTNMRDIMKWWKNRFGRDSLDGKGGKVEVIVHAYDLEILKGLKLSIGKSNAAWNHGLQQLWITDKKDDYRYTEAFDIEVLTHETTHAVLQYIASCCLAGTNNIYVSSLNEGYADIFACIKAEDWRHGGYSGIVAYGENFECYRDLANPYNENSLAGYQLKVLKKNPKQDAHLFGLLFVGHVAYLMHKDNNPANGLTWDELGKVWYESMHMGLDATSNFYDVRRCVIWAAMKINLSAEKLAAIKAAFDKVGIEAQDANFGTIYGTVRDKTDPNKVLEGVSVTASEKKLRNGKIKSVLAGRTFTDAQGKYAISLEAGKYILSFDKTGYISESIDVAIVSSEDVSADKTLTPSEISLSGTIRNASDNSYIAGAAVRVRRTGSDKNLKSTTTDVNGLYYFDLTGQEIGTYTVTASKEKYKSNSVEIVIHLGDVIQDLTLEPESEDIPVSDDIPASDDVVLENIPIDEAHFPDELFRRYISEEIDTDKDGILSRTEIENTTEINVFHYGYYGINSLQGIKYFVNLKTLVCEGNNLTDLDVSGCTDLQELSCGENQLATLNISGCTALWILDCSYNKLASLNVSECTALQQLYCYDNQLTALDVSNKTKLETLGCTGNRLTTLNVSNDTALRRLWCKENQLTALDLSSCPNIDRNDVYCDNGVIITWPSSAMSSAYAPPASQSGLSSANDSTVILAVLPAFTPSATGTYSFTVQLNVTPPEGLPLVLLADSEDLDASFTFTDSTDVVRLSADFTAGRFYAPVVATIHENESQSGGCDVGTWSIMIFLAGMFFMKK